MSHEQRLGFFTGVLIVLVIFLVINLILSFIFKYSIKSNRIQPGKITRMFYMDDEKFIRQWEKKRKKGKLKNFLCNFIIYGMVILATSVVYLVVTGSDFNLPLFCGLLIGNIIGLPVNWNRNEDKYNKLVRNRK